MPSSWSSVTLEGRCFKVVRGSQSLGWCTDDMICCSLLDWFSIPNHVASNHGSDSPRVFTSVIGWKNLFLSNRVYPAPIFEYPAPTFELSTDCANLPWVLTAFPNIDLYIVGFSPTLETETGLCHRGLPVGAYAGLFYPES